MSRATGYVWDASGRQVGSAMYDGTTDCMWTRIYPDRRAAWGAYTESKRAYEAAGGFGVVAAYDAEAAVTMRKCVCGAEPEHGFVGTDYGSLSYWPATYCLTCSAIVEGRKPNEIDDDYKGPHPLDGAPPSRPWANHHSLNNGAAHQEQD